MLKLALVFLVALTANAQKPGSRPVPVPDPVTRPQDYRFYKEQQYKQIRDAAQRQLDSSYMRAKQNPQGAAQEFDTRKEINRQYSQQFSDLTNRLNPGSSSSSSSSYPSRSYPSSSAPSYSGGSVPSYSPSPSVSVTGSRAGRYVSSADGPGWDDVVKGDSTVSNVAGVDIPKGVKKYRFASDGQVELYPDLSTAKKEKDAADAALAKAAKEQKALEEQNAFKQRYATWGLEQTANNEKWIKDQSNRLKDLDNVWAVAKVKKQLAAQDKENQNAVVAVLKQVEGGAGKAEIEESWKKHVNKLSDFPTVDDLYETEDARYPLTVKEPAGCDSISITLNRDGTAAIPKAATIEGLTSVASLGKHCLIVAKKIDWKDPANAEKPGEKSEAIALLLTAGKFGARFHPGNEKLTFVKAAADAEKKNFLLWQTTGKDTGTLEIEPVTHKVTVGKTQALPIDKEFFE